MLLSIVSPIYRGEKMLDELVSRIEASVTTFTDDYEIILVNDASPDESWSGITRICAQDKKVKGINLSRNFGQHYAISAGLSKVSGEWIVVMDCDLQDRPEEIPNLYKKAQEGFDIVYARRVARKDKFMKRLSSTLFHAVFDYLAGTKSDKTISNFGVYKRQVIDEYNKLPEKARSFGDLVRTLGFDSAKVDVEHSERAEGTSSYNLEKLLKLSFDVIISNSNKPLKMATTIGFFMSLFSFILALYNLFAKFIGLIQVEGYTSTIFSIWFVGGLILFVLGIIGLYIGKIFDQVKNRPLFIIKNQINID